MHLQPDLAGFALSFTDLRDPGAFDALVDVVVMRPRLHHLCFWSCTLPPAAPALARALRDGGVTQIEFGFGDNSGAFLDPPGGASLGVALRASSTLISLVLRHLPEPASDVAAPIVAALVGHSSLQKLDLSFTQLSGAAISAALAALLAADAPALMGLNLMDCRLDEAELGPLGDALARNSHLRMLNIRANYMTADFMRARFTPAVRANTSLRKLIACVEDYAIWGDDRNGHEDEDDEAAREMENIVAAR